LEVERRAGGRLFHAHGLMDLQRRTRDVLVVPPDQRSTLSVADDVRYCRQTLSFRPIELIETLFKIFNFVPESDSCYSIRLIISNQVRLLKRS